MRGQRVAARVRLVLLLLRLRSRGRVLFFFAERAAGNFAFDLIA
jgi:hypothetical protein